MVSRKWVEATNEYNVWLETMGATFIKKILCALFDKLGAIEAKVAQRIATGNFKSAKGNKDFWQKHCHAIAMAKPEQGGTDLTKQYHAFAAMFVKRLKTGPEGGFLFRLYNGYTLSPPMPEAIV
ncbi:hypothetical protein SERLA73DRAFT_156746 [Serpula lacrymans var. lacrymans S7.3]|uniref:Uncharacterized protein n=2 Tax=Serpula lacrymans var. lacrymans TaxID=341189 RepID=F8QFS8_SERL3|nr:uncharacterized protein SERLADRAFT_405628 [Serpula lacrymans var. lacrymans S7.9]EGN92912.1 hypothetical protein SERLA73DRAFT_156746 [Serpula lacrymans var. lacrymans S7.3]EGO29743.1 hypothetical protein SERLADRAFT_405628 [Serpula lacrymans var. lacrymans S7.9]